MTTTVGIIGLGNAGSSIAMALSGQLPLLGFDVDATRRRVVADLAMEVVDSVTEIADRATHVLLSLPQPAISRAVVAELVDGAQAPELIIETSTITPNVAQDLHAMCQAGGVRFVDAAIAGGVASMAAGEIEFLVGGEPDDVAHAHVVLEPIAKHIMHLGPVGMGMGAKVCLVRQIVTIFSRCKPEYAAAHGDSARRHPDGGRSGRLSAGGGRPAAARSPYRHVRSDMADQ